jgi:hypothetical protein
MQPKITTEQLLIIGNGFDLACGLKSGYKDFFETIPEEKYRDNFWYYILACLRNRDLLESENWADIELQIFNQLKNIEILYKDNFIHRLDKESDSDYIGYINNYLKQHRNDVSLDSVTPESLEITYMGLVITKDQVADLPKTIEKALNYSFDHLKQLEQDFCVFLSKQIKEEFNTMFSKTISQNDFEPDFNNYFERSKKLLNHILKAYYPNKHIMSNSPDNQTETSKFNGSNDILSFNYTLPVDAFNLYNIHGRLSSKNIIFGINYDSLISYFTNSPIQFSKSYRILENGFSSNIHLSKTIKNILFYGHGLGEADYPYFQSIFDSIDLYHGNTRLIFFWDAYDENKKLELHKEMLNKVVNLIEKYGQTFSNKDHGRNLLTKLKVENRILIKEIYPKELFKENIKE